MNNFSRLEKYHGITPEDEHDEALDTTPSLESEESFETVRSVNKLERYNRFLNRAIFTLVVLLTGIFVTIFFF
ncbi:hypothetical protein J7S27_03330 [Carnobacteriaceae bacterium zg-C25]|nr:hypothetical protein J7S27_03330 [Carnobacteriaceae bacterium zg-C25]